jgi:zinc transporter ZupT
MFDATFWTVLIAATLTAVATGLGALPFLFVRRLSLFWVSIANAAAGGFMFAATHSLVAEGVTISPARLVAGMVIGLVGIVIGKMLIVEREHASIAGLVKLDARKAMLFIGVMTAHSFAEGCQCGRPVKRPNRSTPFFPMVSMTSRIFSLCRPIPTVA